MDLVVVVVEKLKYDLLLFPTREYCVPNVYIHYTVGISVSVDRLYGLNLELSQTT